LLPGLALRLLAVITALERSLALAGLPLLTLLTLGESLLSEILATPSAACAKVLLR
jgi:hypothetical protein